MTCHCVRAPPVQHRLGFNHLHHCLLCHCVFRTATCPLQPPQALEFQVQQGLAGGTEKHGVWLAPAPAPPQRHADGGAGGGEPSTQPLHVCQESPVGAHVGCDMHANAAVLRLLLGPGDGKWMPDAAQPTDSAP